MRTGRVLVFFIALCLQLNAQLFDSLPSVFRQKQSIDARLESRYSFIGGDVAAMNGVRLGIAYQRKLRMGGGLSWLNTPLPARVPVYETATGFRNWKYLKFAYLCYYIDVVFYKTKRWQLSVPLQLGTGMMWYQHKRGYHLTTGETKYFILFYEPGITVQYKITKWFGLGSDVAYRFALKDNRRVPQRLSSPTYSFKILFWFDQLYFDLFPESALTKKYGPAFW